MPSSAAGMPSARAPAGADAPISATETKAARMPPRLGHERCPPFAVRIVSGIPQAPGCSRDHAGCESPDFSRNGNRVERVQTVNGRIERLPRHFGDGDLAQRGGEAALRGGERGLHDGADER